jgi:glycosyltransferase involved in cell wall biosynthesis
MLMFTSVLPSTRPDNAGARYVQWVVEALRERFPVFAVAPDGPASRRARENGEVPSHTLVPSHSSYLPARLEGFISRALIFTSPVHVRWRYGRDVLRDQALGEMIRNADVIDLQWEEQAALLPLIRRLNPRARVVCTLHDVLSQRYGRARESATSVPRRFRWRWAEAAAQRAERKILKRADAVVVFSEKDALLLPAGRAKVHVVTPPLATGLEGNDRSDPVPGEVLFVGLLSRWENEEGLLWFLSDVWPRIQEARPEARFRIAGLGARQRLVEAAQLSGAELLGFVPDLQPLYKRASVVVAPLRLGAGVKFKVVDALLAGVPVVTTPVGAEGIGGPSWFAGMEHDAAAFANAVVEVLRDQSAAERRSAVLNGDILEKYGLAAFNQKIMHVYRADNPPDANGGSTSPEREGTV